MVVQKIKIFEYFFCLKKLRFSEKSCHLLPSLKGVATSYFYSFVQKYNLCYAFLCYVNNKTIVALLYVVYICISSPLSRGQSHFSRELGAFPLPGNQRAYFKPLKLKGSGNKKDQTWEFGMESWKRSEN